MYMVGWESLHLISNINNFTLESKKSFTSSASTFSFTVLLLHDADEECVDSFLRFVNKVIDVLQNAQNARSTDIVFLNTTLFNIPKLNQEPIDVAFIVPWQRNNNIDLE